MLFAADARVAATPKASYMMETTSALSRQHSLHVGWRFWLQWVLANAFGFGVGFPLGVMIIYQTEGITEIQLSALVVLLGWIIVSVPAAITQWLALRPVRSDARWIVATIIGCAAGLGISVAFPLIGVPPVVPSFLTAPGFGFACGAGAGLFQAHILRCSIRRAAIWVLVSAAGWALGFALLDPLQAISWMFGTAVSLFASGATVGAVSGVLTGVAPVWLLRPEEHAESGQPG